MQQEGPAGIIQGGGLIKKLTPEKQVQAAVVKYLKFMGWIVMRNQQGLGSTPGRPDIEALKNGVVIWIECKAPKGRLSESQQKYIESLRKNGGIVFVTNNFEVFMGELERLEDDLWPGKRLKRLF